MLSESQWFSRNTVLKWPAMLAAIFILLAAGWLIYPHIDNYLFDKSARSLLEANADLVRGAETFSQEKALNALEKYTPNGFYYRFDDHVYQAEYIGPKRGTENHPAILSLEFTDNDAVAFLVNNETARLSEGRLIIPSSQNGCLEACLPVSVASSEVSEIEFRIKAQKSNSVQLGWSEDAQADCLVYSVFNRVRLDIIPDGTFHEYRVDLKDTLSLMPMTIQKIFFQPTAIPGDRVEIDYIRLISKKKEYLIEGFGNSYEKKENQVRPVLFHKSPGEIRYQLTLPDKPCYLSFGCGIMAGVDYVDFRIDIICQGLKKRLFAKQINTPSQWYDERLDLSAFSGKIVEIAFRADSLQDTSAFWSNPIAYSLPEKRMNVIVVLEDALRSDHMSCYGYNRNTTPVKTEWSKSGIRFINAFSQATFTMASVASIMTSLYPTATGVWHLNDKLHKNYLTLAEVLRNQGYETSAFLLHSSAGYNIGLHQGFSQTFDPLLGRAKHVYEFAIPQWIAKHRDRNFFIYTHVVDPHGPYEPPEEFNKWYKQTKITNGGLPRELAIDPYWVKNPTVDSRRSLYDGEIYFNDYYFGIFLEKLKKMGLYDNTLIIFISDHGEFLGEHGFWRHHPPGFSQGIKTPMIMSCPAKIPAGRAIREMVQNIDIFPTILEILNINSSGMLHQGRSLLPLINNDDTAAWRNRIVISDEVLNRRNTNDFRPLGSIFFKNKHVLCSTGIGVALFNTDDDPEEIKGKTLQGRRRDKYSGFISNLQKENFKILQTLIRGTRQIIQYDPQAINRLKALGYLNGIEQNRNRGLSASVKVMDNSDKDLTGDQAAVLKKDNYTRHDIENQGSMFYRKLERHIDNLEGLSEVEKRNEYQRIYIWTESLFKETPANCKKEFLRFVAPMPVADIYYLLTETEFRYQRQLILDYCVSRNFKIMMKKYN